MNFIKTSLSRARLEKLVTALAATGTSYVGEKRKGDGDKKKSDSDKKRDKKGDGDKKKSEKEGSKSGGGAASAAASSSPSADCVAAHVPKPCQKTCGQKTVCETMDGRDKAAGQLNEFKKLHTTPAVLTTSHGATVGCKTSSLTAGPLGPMLFQDFIYMDEMAHFARERIPERVVHAKGAGAFGHFEVTHDITKYCKAGVFQRIGKKTPVAVRFSTVGGESGSADTVRDPRGFAIKFYTDEGNWDLVGNNTPVFFIRDPILFPSFVHTQKRNPVTHLKDFDMFWDFIGLRPETTHQVAIMFSDRGIPDGYRHMNGYGSHTFKMINKEGSAYYCKFHLKTDQCIKNLTEEEAEKLAACDPDYAIRDLYNAIACKDCPSWTLYIQIMPLEEAENTKDWNPFDVTKVWPHGTYPLIPVGKLCLNRNPKNYFAEVEQIALSPAHLVPGIEPSPDKMLQGRLLIYSDAHNYRLGVNYAQIPVNCPYKSKVNNYQRDGSQTMDTNQDGAPNYFPNSFSGPVDCSNLMEFPMNLQGQGQRYPNPDEDNFSQTGLFYQQVLNDEEKDRLAKNIARHLSKAQCCIQERVVANFTMADSQLGDKIAAGLAACNDKKPKKEQDKEADKEKSPC